MTLTMDTENRGLTSPARAALWQYAEALILDQHDRVLLVEIDDADEDGGRGFVLPGGHAEAAQDVHSALLDGVSRAIGVDVDTEFVLVTHYVAATASSPPGQIFTFDCAQARTKDMTMGPGVHAAHWIAPRDIAEYVSDEASYRIHTALETLEARAGTPYIATTSDGRPAPNAFSAGRFPPPMEG